MKFNATIELDKVQVLEIITQYLDKQGIKISHQDIHFKIEKVEKGGPKYPYTAHELTGIKISNIQIGGE